MGLWDATRATSIFITSSYSYVQATVGSGSSYDVVSSAPDTTTCMSFCPGSVSAGNGQVVWKSWQAPVSAPNSWYEFGIRIACQSMGTAYFSFDYSVDSGVGWTNFISSVGGSNLSATTIVKSVSGALSVSSLWVRLNTTNTHRRSRAQLYDVFLVGSYSQTYNMAIGDTVGITDKEYHPGVATNWKGVTGDNAGVTDSVNRRMTIVRGCVS